mmetsp:Transcript_33101/g.53163  ORF Transcript_33101/g.53163 Transcript_33101/m.53163 type:complete len:203 (-) Transcript_33101:388-996(-)
MTPKKTQLVWVQILGRQLACFRSQTGLAIHDTGLPERRWEGGWASGPGSASGGERTREIFLDSLSPLHATDFRWIVSWRECCSSHSSTCLPPFRSPLASLVPLEVGLAFLRAFASPPPLLLSFAVASRPSCDCAPPSFSSPLASFGTYDLTPSSPPRSLSAALPPLEFASPLARAPAAVSPQPTSPLAHSKGKAFASQSTNS